MEYRYAECRYAECRYAECRYTECRGAFFCSKDWSRTVFHKRDELILLLAPIFKTFPSICCDKLECLLKLDIFIIVL